MARYSWGRLSLFLVFSLLAFFSCVQLVPVLEHWVSLQWAEGLALLLLLPLLLVAADLLMGAQLRQALVQTFKAMMSGLLEALNYWEIH